MKRSSTDNQAIQDHRQQNFSKRFLKFGVVGVLGFIVDSGVLYAAIGLGLDHYSARGLSFFCAVTVTWLANRRLTFSRMDRPTLAEWLRYVMANMSGSALNLGIYTILVSNIIFFEKYPIVGVGIGSISGLCLNYNLSRRIVFKS